MSDPAERIYERLLVVRLQAGDEAAFVELAEQYSPRLRYYLRKMLGDPDGADDALQEVWLDVFRGASQLADPAAFPAWIYRIARDRACRELRRVSRSPRELGDEEPLEASTDNETEFSPEDAARIHAALDELPPEQREALVLRFLESMSYEAIADVVGCPVGTVRSRIHYAKRALRRLLEQEQPS
jgi:RNA polymerase sigma-70 factor (ECF subfamily)